MLWQIRTERQCFMSCSTTTPKRIGTDIRTQWLIETTALYWNMIDKLGQSEYFSRLATPQPRTVEGQTCGLRDTVVYRISYAILKYNWQIRTERRCFPSCSTKASERWGTDKRTERHSGSKEWQIRIARLWGKEWFIKQLNYDWQIRTMFPVLLHQDLGK